MSNQGSTTLRQRIGPSDHFAALTFEFLVAFDRHECTDDEYMTGLRYAIGELEIALQAAKEKT